MLLVMLGIGTLLRSTMRMQREVLVVGVVVSVVVIAVVAVVAAVGTAGMGTRVCAQEPGPLNNSKGS